MYSNIFKINAYISRYTGNSVYNAIINHPKKIDLLRAGTLKIKRKEIKGLRGKSPNTSNPMDEALAARELEATGEDLVPRAARTVLGRAPVERISKAADGRTINIKAIELVLCRQKPIRKAACCK